MLKRMHGKDPIHSWWNCKSSHSRNVWRILKELKINLPYDSAIPPFGQEDTLSYSIDMAQPYSLLLCSQQLRNGNNLNFHQLVNNENEHTNTMENYPYVKTSDTMKFTGKWVETKHMVINEITQSQKDKCHMFSLWFQF